MGTSGKPVSPARRKRVIADYAECQNYSEVARKHNLSVNGVKKIVLADPKSAELCKQKADEQMQDAIAYLTSRNPKMYILVDKLIDAMTEKTKDLDMFTNIRDLAVTFGTVVDKMVKLYEIKSGSDGKQQADDGFIAALNAVGSEVFDDGIDEPADV